METNNAIPVITINISKSPLWLNSVFVSADVSVINGALSSNMSVYGLYSEAEGAAGGWDSTELTQWAVGAVWAPVSGLTVQLEYSANDEESKYSRPWYEDKETIDSDRFAIRVTRSF